jgi:SRSO17 transposase
MLRRTCGGDAGPTSRVSDYWVERALQDARRHSGLGDYQVRGWLGWHHHMAIVLMAMLFMLEERGRYGANVPMLSTADVERLLKHYLPRRWVAPAAQFNISEI